MRGRGQSIFEIVGAIINLLVIINKRNTFLQDPVSFVRGSLFLNFLHFWGLDIPTVFIFSGNCYLKLNQ